MSRALVLEERSWDSLARRQGWVDWWTVGGRGGGEDIVEGARLFMVGEGCWCWCWFGIWKSSLGMEGEGECCCGEGRLRGSCLS